MASRIGPMIRRTVDQLLADGQDPALDVDVAAKDRLLHVDQLLADDVEGREEGVHQLVKGDVQQVAGSLDGQLPAGLDPAGERCGVDRYADRGR